MMFGFDDGYAMFDMTPVDNQFIQEYLPHADGDAVRVYLYGLMRCYHPEEGMLPAQMARDLNMKEEDVLRAYRYWEKNGLVRRIGDNPPRWRYVSLRKSALEGTVSIDPGYESFTEDLYRAFGDQRQLHGSEIQTCYEWVEELHLSPETVIMLLRHMMGIRGKNFSIRSAEKLAMQMADEGFTSEEDAVEFLSRDQEIWDGTRKVLRRLGKRNAPSEDQVAMYRKWVREWGFTPGAIEAACGETAKGDPNMGYLDGILNRLRTRAGEGEKLDRGALEQDREKADRIRKVLSALGSGSVSEPMVEWFDELAKSYTDDMILLAARECGKNAGNPEDVKRMLESWRKKGITTGAEAEQYIAEFRARSGLLRELRGKWGLSGRMGEADRKLLGEWEDLGFDREMILHCADFAAGTERPMAYLDKLLRAYAEKGIRTIEAADRERESHQEEMKKNRGTGRQNTLPAQQYEQRDYSEEMETPEEMLARLKRGVGFRA